MTPFNLDLRYTLQPGWLGPYVGALLQGQALAYACEDCGGVSFPPLKVCACGSLRQRWVQLSGRASVRFFSSGTDGRFGLVRFDGATTDAVARLEGFGATGRRGALVAAATDRPAIVLHPIAAGDDP